MLSAGSNNSWVVLLFDRIGVFASKLNSLEVLIGSFLTISPDATVEIGFSEYLTAVLWFVFLSDFTDVGNLTLAYYALNGFVLKDFYVVWHFSLEVSLLIEVPTLFLIFSFYSKFSVWKLIWFSLSVFLTLLELSIFNFPMPSWVFDLTVLRYCLGPDFSWIFAAVRF